MFFYWRKGQLCGFGLPRLFVLCVGQAVAGRPQERGRISDCRCVGYKKCDSKKTTKGGCAGAAGKDRGSVSLRAGFCEWKGETRLDLPAAGLCAGKPTEKIHSTDKKFLEREFDRMSFDESWL